MNTEKWLRMVTAYRELLSPDERREALLWSWPVRRAVTAAPPPKPWNWRCSDYDKECHPEVFERGKRVTANLELLASDWYPFCSPRTIGDQAYDTDFLKRCKTIYEDLSELDEPLPYLNGSEAQEYLAELIETHWGDGERNARRELLSYTLDRVERKQKKHLLQVYRILERARDHAFMDVQTSKQLHDTARRKRELGIFLAWLQQASSQARFVEEELGRQARARSAVAFVFGEPVGSFYEAYQCMLEHKRKVREFLRHGLQEVMTNTVRYQRERTGRPKCIWVEDAHRHLSQLHISAADRRALLRACVLLRLEKE